MKRKLIYILLFLFPVVLMAQNDTLNWVKSTVYKVKTTENPNPTIHQKVVQVNYFDGLGRPIQSINIGQSATGKDIITHIEYDALGRQDKDYLPYTDDDISLDYRDNAKVDLIQYYQDEEYDFTRTDSQEINPYSQKQFEASPLNRVLKQAAPGGKWALGNEHEIKFDYKTNTANEVRLFTFTTTYNSTTKMYDIVESSLQTGNFYAANQLYKNITIDENNAVASSEKTSEYKDKSGRVVLKRVRASIVANKTLDNTQTFDTYYVYDDFGNLTYVLPPLVDTNATITETILNDLCYQYKYDYRNRLVAKKIPSKQWEFIVYDRLDRVRATGPTASPFSDLTGEGWLITNYDVFNRPILTAWLPATVFDAGSRSALENNINNESSLSETKLNESTSSINGVTFQYSKHSNTTNYHVLTVNYYDKYNSNIPTLPTTVLGQDIRDGSTAMYKGLKTLQTGSWIRILESSTDTNANLSYTFYKADRLSSPIRTVIEYPEGGFTQTDSAIDFEGKVLQTITTHKKNNTSSLVTTQENFTYSPQGRLLTNTHKVDNDPTENIVTNEYKELGELKTKYVGQTVANPLQNVDYKYNIRGWLTQINTINDLVDENGGEDDLFAFKINYNQTDDANTIPLFNGNISETYWRTSADNMTRKYSYDYDGLNRLLLANYRNVDLSIDDTYNEALTYDKNGNIQSLLRNGNYESQTTLFQIDNLSYLYQENSNQLKKVIDATNSIQGFKDGGDNTPDPTISPDYIYDLYGNLTKDQNKGINNIIYNHLSLPTEIQFTQNRTIKYKYDATGVKLEKIVFDGDDTNTTITTYLNGYQYENKPVNLTGGFGESRLLFFPTAEGYVKPVYSATLSVKEPKYQYVYNLLDQVNNIRISFSKVDGQLKVLEENNYYPFGLKHSNYNQTRKKLSRKITNDQKTATPTIENPYKYNFQKQERQEEFDLNWDSFKYRNYDFAIGRFMSVDPLAETYSYQSPYNFAENKVVANFELEGLEAVSIHNRSFAPFKSFGGGFSGDGADRGFTTSQNVTSRISQTVDIDFNQSTPSVSGGQQVSNTSHHPVLGTDRALVKEGLKNVQTGETSTGAKQVSFQTEIEGANPLTPSFATPNIDVDGIFSISSNQETGVLSISANITGDNFPSAESFISDSVGNSVFIGVSALQGTPFSSLPGEGGKAMINTNFSINFNSEGTFQSVNYNSQQYNIQDYNNLFETQNPDGNN